MRKALLGLMVVGMVGVGYIASSLATNSVDLTETLINLILNQDEVRTVLENNQWVLRSVGSTTPPERAEGAVSAIYDQGSDEIRIILIQFAELSLAEPTLSVQFISNGITEIDSAGLLSEPAKDLLADETSREMFQEPVLAQQAYLLEFKQEKDRQLILNFNGKVILLRSNLPVDKVLQLGVVQLAKLNELAPPQ